MKVFKNHLKEKLKNKEFAKLYEEEKEISSLAIKISELRKTNGLTQAQLARKAHITQQQLSKVENGINCNMSTFFKVCNALGLRIRLYNEKKLIS